MFKNLSLEHLGISGRQSEIIELALSYGFKGIDLDLTDFNAQVQAKGLPHARRLLDSSRLKIGAFRLPVVWDEDDDAWRKAKDELPPLAEMAASLGCTRSVTTIAPANDLRPYHENFEFHRRRLTELAELLAPFKISLGLEFSVAPELRRDRAFQFIHSLDALVMLVGMIRSPRIGIAVDLWQIHAAGGSLDEVKKLSPEQLVAVYLSDAPATSGGEPSDESRLLPGETGTIDAAGALTLLAELGFNGPVTPWPHANRFKGLSRDASVKLAGEKLDQVWKAAGLTPAGKLAVAAGKK